MDDDTGYPPARGKADPVPGTVVLDAKPEHYATAIATLSGTNAVIIGCYCGDLVTAQIINAHTQWQQHKQRSNK